MRTSLPFTMPLVFGVTLALTACGTVKNPLERTLPDETQVLAGPDLSLPPSFELRPPRQGDASEALLRLPSQAAVSGTVGADSWLVNQAQIQAGTVRDANIRTELDANAVTDQAKEAEAEKQKGPLQRWFGRK